MIHAVNSGQLSLAIPPWVAQCYIIGTETDKTVIAKMSSLLWQGCLVITAQRITVLTQTATGYIRMIFMAVATSSKCYCFFSLKSQSNRRL